MGKIKRSYKTVCQYRKHYRMYSPAPAHIHILMHKTEVAERIFSRLFIENFDRGWDHIRHLEFLRQTLFAKTNFLTLHVLFFFLTIRGSVFFLSLKFYFWFSSFLSFLSFSFKN